MNIFVQLLQQEIISTIEGLTGIAPKVELNKEENGESKIKLAPPLAKADVSVSGDMNGQMRVTLATSLATAIGDMMLGGEGDEKEEMDAEDLDATKEIISNVLSSFSRSLASQKNMPKLNFTVDKVDFIAIDGSIDFHGYGKLFIYNLAIHNSHDMIAFALSDSLSSVIDGDSQPAENTFSGEPSSEPSKKTTPAMSPEEISNIEL
ncbi:MAG: flagellar motor switch protein FliN, partial [Sulfurospirillaceae bacterium]|nr:flagellar motor switch protein FliN [Sulfurospirillaceae bacterium]